MSYPSGFSLFKQSKTISEENRTYAEVARSIRNRLRRYNLKSIINIGLKKLARSHSNKRQELLTMPWLVALVIKLAIEDSLVGMEVGEECTESEFVSCCNDIWNSKQNLDVPVQVMLLGLRSSMHTQLIFQNPESLGFLRWSALISRLDRENPSYILFERVFKMSPDDFMLSATLLMSQFKAQSPSQPLNLKIYSGLNEKLIIPFIGVIDIFSKSLVELRKLLKDELRSRLQDGQSARPNSEKNEFPWLAKYPILKLDENYIQAWSSTIFFHGIEEAVHNRLSMFGQEYTDSFSKVFESYVIELIRESSVHPITDEDFKKIGNKGMNAVDALIPSKLGNVFIESKMSLFPDDVLLSDKPFIVKRKLKRIREAIVQGWKVGDLIRTEEIKIADAKYAVNDYLIIVTSRQLLFGNGIHLQRWIDEQFFNSILPESRFFAPSEVQLSHMPPQNIVILSIDEFEHLVGAVKSGKTTYLSFVKRYSEIVLDPETSKLLADQLIADDVDKWYVPDLIRKSGEDIQNRVKDILKV